MDVVNSRPEETGGAVASQVIPLGDDRYPPLLREIHDPPERLYVRGDPALLQRPQLAVVGSRRASPAAIRATETLCSLAVGAGLGICSGLALGIDGAAHRGALAAGGTSIAVMATGIERIYPARHRALAVELEQRGCLVTEFPPGTPPRRGNFPRRNRVISGLSLGVLVVEAALPSGSLITAGTALEQGREVFALPWSILHPGGAGCLRLIRDGAKMVQTVEDILEELGPLYQLQRELAGNSGLSLQAPPEKEDPVLALLGFETVTVDELVAVSGLPIARVMSALSELELGGRVARCAGGYVRC